MCATHDSWRLQGYYKLYLDGARISTHELGAFTTFAKRVYYDTYDLTRSIQQYQRETGAGKHAIGVAVGRGWYAQKSVAVGPPSLLLRLSIDLDLSCLPPCLSALHS